MITLAITDTLKPTLQAYLEWIRKVFEEVQMEVLSSGRQNLARVSACDGIVLTGGGDVHPKYYERVDSLPIARGVDESRDEFEFAVITLALQRRLPVLGVCRGMQAFNVAMGGTLIPDLKTAGFQDHGKVRDVERRHGVTIVPGSTLYTIAHSATGEVNSSHHQAVERSGDGLRVTARSTDGVIEGMEWSEPEGKPFLQLVQWHPERMDDFKNPLSRGLLDRFAAEVRESLREKEKTTVQYHTNIHKDK